MTKLPGFFTPFADSILSFSSEIDSSKFSVGKTRAPMDNQRQSASNYIRMKILVTSCPICDYHLSISLTVSLRSLG